MELAPNTKQSAVCGNLVKPSVGSMLSAKATSTKPAASKNNQTIICEPSFLRCAELLAIAYPPRQRGRPVLSLAVNHRGPSPYHRAVAMAPRD